MSNRLILLAVAAVSALLGAGATQWMTASTAEAQSNAASSPAPKIAIQSDESHPRFTYVNAFRTNGNSEEVILELGMNLPDESATGGNATPRFTPTERIVLDYYTAKRLAITLSTAVRKYESQFGDLELDVQKRLKTSK